MNNELWTFSFDESFSLPVPGKGFNLTETSTGIFLASTLMTSGSLDNTGVGGVGVDGGPGGGVGVGGVRGGTGGGVAGMGIGMGMGTGPNSGSGVSITASNLSTLSSTATTPGPYLPFINAVRSLIRTYLASPTLFVPFGQSLISVAGQKLLHIDPILTPMGELIIKVYYERIPLVLVKEHPKYGGSWGSGTESIGDTLPSMTVYLSPSALSGVIIEKSLKPPSNISISHFLSLFELGTNSEFASSDRYTFKEWLKIRLSSSNKDVLWPADLCFTILSENASENSSNFDADWSDTSHIFDQAENQIEISRAALTKRSSMNNNLRTTNSNLQVRQQAGNQVPHLSTQAQPQNYYTVGSARPNMPLSSEGELKRNGVSNVYPTPPDPQGRLLDRSNNLPSSNLDSSMSASNDNDNNWTPGANMANETWGDLDEELFGDNQEITEADFNFFDQPEEHEIGHEMDMDGSERVIEMKEESQTEPQPSTQSEPSFLPKSPTPDQSSPQIIQPKKEDLTKDQNRQIHIVEPNLTKHSIISIEETETENEKDIELSSSENIIAPPSKRRKSIFSALTFNTLISSGLDSKYHAGGRFFVPDPEASDDDDSSSESDYNETLQHSDNTSVTESNKITTPSSDSRQVPTMINPSDQSLDYASSWLQLMTQSIVVNDLSQTSTLPTNLINIGDDTRLLTLLEQIVWDSGVLSELLAPTQYLEVPDTTVIRKTIALFPDLSSITISDLMRMSSSRSLRSDGTKSINSSGESDVKTDGKQLVSQPSELSEDQRLLGPTQASEQTQERQQQQPDQFQDQYQSRPTLQPLEQSHGQNQVQKPSIQPAEQPLDLQQLQKSSRPSDQPQDQQLQNQSLLPQQKPSQLLQDQQSNIIPSTQIHATANHHTNRTEALNRLIPNEAFPVSPPLYSIRRLNQPLKARAPILRFWKIFGLTPLHGGKDIILLMLCPSGNGVIHACKAYNEFLKNTYEGCGLGNVDLGEFGSYRDGIVPVLNSAHDSNLSSAISEIARLADSSVDKKIVILTTCRTSDISMILSISAAISSIRQRSSIVWQSIDLNDVAHGDTILVPSQSSTVRLALALYDKCSNDELNSAYMSLCRRAPSFTLSRMPPPKISFKLTMDSPTNLMDEDSLLHVSYAVSEDDRWVAVAWSDQWGEMSMVDAICLKRPGSRLRGLEEACAEIWDKTISIAGRRSNHWRVILAKVGSRMDSKELNMWLRLSESTNGQNNINASGVSNNSINSMPTPVTSSLNNQKTPNNRNSNISFLYVVCVYYNSPLMIHGSSIFPYEKFFEQAKSSISIEGGKGTPVTPQRGMGDMDSPDMYGINIATPSSAGHNPMEADKQQHDTTDDIVMVDVKDDAYGFLLHDSALQLVQSSIDQGETVVSKPAIVGILLKPPINSGSQLLLRLQVSMVHSPTSAPMMMKSLLLQYRRLASLGEASGVSNDTTVIPWHVEACTKMLRVLNRIE